MRWKFCCRRTGGNVYRDYSVERFAPRRKATSWTHALSFAPLRETVLVTGKTESLQAAEPRAAVRAAGRRLMRREASGVRRTVERRPRLLVYIAILGPGMITANAGNDGGGIATFASIGAEFGYSLLWILIPITISLGIVQECAPAWAP